MIHLHQNILGFGNQHSVTHHTRHWNHCDGLHHLSIVTSRLTMLSDTNPFNQEDEEETFQKKYKVANLHTGCPKKNGD